MSELLSDYRIDEHVEPTFDTHPINCIDFTLHLKPDIALNKVVTMLDNGRPGESKYYIGTELMAKICFEFVDYNSLMVDKKLKLYYVKKDLGESGEDLFSQPVLIKHKIYDLTDAKDGSASVQERVDARGEIVSALKAHLSGVLMQSLTLSMTEVIALITPFWHECELQRTDFIEFGSSSWKDYLDAIDLATTTYTFLSQPVDSLGNKMRDYMGAKLDF